MRILREVSIKFRLVALEGDVWELCRADAVDLIAMESAERVTEPREIEVRSAGLEVLARGEHDPEPKMISRIPDHARKPRTRIEFPPNLSLGNVLPPSWR